MFIHLLPHSREKKPMDWVSNAAGRGFDRGEHRRGFSEAREGRQSAVHDTAEGSIEESRYYLVLAQD